MAKSLVVVESPAKAKTINKYLGRDYKVVASMGHVRDLPKSKLGVDVDNDFAEEYESLASRKKVLKELKDAAKDATDIYIATDPDREGEAIGWHLVQELKGKKRKIHRLTFNEITKKAVQDALKHPREIDEKMVAAQRARRVLDRLVGYKISPLLWDKVRRGLSAGRVQSVALKLVCDREREIEAFVPEEYWNVFARLAGPQPPEFEVKLLKKKGDAIKVTSEEQSKGVLADLEGATWTVASVATKERKRNPAPPFITSKLQQTSRFPVKKTMMLAQQLYEGVELPGLGVEGTVGLITYMRTDSVRVSDDAVTAVREHISTTFGGDYLPEKANFYKTKSDAQDAHEAIRPTSMQYDPETVRSYLTPDEYSLYRLIWNRFVASQMTPATFDETTVDVSAGDYLFRVKGTVPKFAGWMATYGLTPGETEEADQDKKDDDDEDGVSGVLPPLAEGDRLELKLIRPEQKFTQPPARFSEATLVKELEENGIGRPSTYASIISVLQDREYVSKIEGRFKPSALGRMISDLLTKSFVDIIDVEYTRSLEDDLDKIEQGTANYERTLGDFYKKFKKDLARAGKEMDDLKKGIEIGEACDKCGSPMLKRVGKFGPFIACSAYPECTNTREVEQQEPESESGEEEIEPCENCGKPMALKRGRFGQFLACTGYPECKTTRKLIATKQGGLRAAKPDQILDEKCPKCGSNLVLKQGRFGEFTACTNYPECKYIKHKSTGVKCPKDADKGGDIVERKSKRGKVFFGCSNYPDCDFVLWNRPIPEPCPKCGAAFLTEKITKKHGRQLICQTEDCDYSRAEDLSRDGVITIIGGGLAGCEAAWQAATLGAQVRLFEMRPVRGTAVHKTDRLAELVCSNSFRGDKLDNAVGLLKEEMRRLGSLVMQVAEESRVPAGAALAVDRERFAAGVTAAVAGHPAIEIVREEITAIPPSRADDPVILATGPLTSDALSADLVRFVGHEHLAFYDAISPIVLAESINQAKVFRQSRWDRSLRRGGGSRHDVAATTPAPACGVDDGQGDYLNCPLTRDEYERFYDALIHAESATVHDFDKEKFFEGCLPIEVMAHRGVDTLRFGPMKPVGLVDPKTGREPYAAVQLRQDTLAGDHYSLVGFQTQIKWGEQARVLRMIPGLEEAEFVRFGMVHRNTYVNGPTVLAETWQVRARPSLFLAGQMSGVEGYVESAASGLLAGLNAAALGQGREPSTPPRTTAIGALAYYVSHADPAHYEPSNITFGIMQPLDRPPRGKMERKLALSARALSDLDGWMSAARASGTPQVRLKPDPTDVPAPDVPNPNDLPDVPNSTDALETR